MGLFNLHKALSALPTQTEDFTPAPTQASLLQPASVDMNVPDMPQVRQGGLHGLISRAYQADPATGQNFWDKLNTFGAHLQDIGDGGDRAQVIDQQWQQKAAKSKQDKLQADYAAQVDQLAKDHSFTPVEAFMAKADPSALARILEGRAPKYFNTADGMATVGPDGEIHYDAGPNADLHRQYLLEQIASARAQAGQRDSAANLNNKKTAVGGFAPHVAKGGGHSAQILGSHSGDGLTMDDPQ